MTEPDKEQSNIPNYEHLEILNTILGEEVWSSDYLIKTKDVLYAMQILQSQIDSLKAECERLRDLINFCQCDQPGCDYGDTVYCARCHKPFDPRLS